MDRRKFLQSAGLTAASLTLAPQMLGQKIRPGITDVPGTVSTDGKDGNVSAGVEDHLSVKGYVKEPAHRIPVAAQADVVVAGGGVAGVAAGVEEVAGMAVSREEARRVSVRKRAFFIAIVLLCLLKKATSSG